MKVFLDDTRPAPEGWVRAYWPEEVIEFLETGEVTDLSLDHDLGDDLHGTGYDVLVWLERSVVIDKVRPPANILVHSANAGARGRMLAAVRSIQRRAAAERRPA
jgi:hypothetical protein